MENGLLTILIHLEAWQALAIIVKALTYGTSLAAAGSVFFITLFSSLISEEENKTIRRISFYLAVAGLGVSVLRIGVMNGMMSGEWLGMFDKTMTKMLLLDSSEGSATGLRLVGLLLMAVIMYQKHMTAVKLAAAVLGAGLAVTSFAIVGHAGEVGFAKWPQGFLSVHLLAVAFWLGALWPLHHLTYNHDLKKIAAIMHRFGTIAAWIVSLLIGMGAILLWMLIGNVAVLWDSSYGRLFLVKLGLVAALLGLAALNKLRLTPLLLKGNLSAVTNIRKSIKAESVVAGLILLVSATLTTVIGPEEHQSHNHQSSEMIP
jgi:putative copper export protein